MEWMICWVVIHTSLDKLDDRKYTQFRGYVMHEGKNDNLVINFYDDFTKKNIDVTVNPVVQSLNGNECSYAK